MSQQALIAVRPQARWRFGKSRARGYGKWTEVEVDLPPYPVAIHILRSPSCTLDNAYDAMALSLDATCRIEIAPRDIVIAVFDSALRHLILSQRICMLDTLSAGDRTVLSFAVPGPRSPAEIDAIVPVLADLGARLREAYTEIGRSAGVAMIGAPFRPALDDAPGQQAVATRQALVAQLVHDRHLRHGQAASRRHVATGAIIAILIALIFAIV